MGVLSLVTASVSSLIFNSVAAAGLVVSKVNPNFTSLETLPNLSSALSVS